MNLRNLVSGLFFALLGAAAPSRVAAAEPFVTQDRSDFVWIAGSEALPLWVDPAEDKGVLRAVHNLQEDACRVTGITPEIVGEAAGRRVVIVGSIGHSGPIRQLLRSGKLPAAELEGKREKFLIRTVSAPFEGVDEALVIAGSDKRGTIYGIYELSEQMGVSPWYDWADVPTAHRETVAVRRGDYTDGEPTVRYRGIFLNDEAPCLTSWVKNTYGTDYGDHRFYERVFELILRLRGNFLWPAMWSWAFYADDPLNSPTANEMGIIMSTSHHEPMARNHQEWARHRKEYGAWNYASNQKTIDRFFEEGIARMKGTEDVVTIGMRGDGDEAMSAEADVALLSKVVANQRRIIRRVTGRPASETPQVWALYKEVLDYYDKGMRVPDDVIMLLCDDNWGNVRRLPNPAERAHAGGWGMYYHVDYVGAPRNSKWLNVTPICNMWEQLQLTYDYGVDRLWVLNVGDLKPMEYPITLFLDMAWNPKRYTAATLPEHTRAFCAQQFGEAQADEAARILELSCKYNGLVTAEMLDRHTYNLETGEWRQVTDQFVRLEAEALRQYLTIDPAARDAYRELILFPVQAMANLYEMYYAQAMNHKRYAEGNPEANLWADRVERAFARDAELCRAYNKEIAGGKWDGMMTQKHIGYRIWNDTFPADQLPEIYRLDHPEEAQGGYRFRERNGVVVMEAEHYYSQKAAPETVWTVHPGMGRTLSGLSLMPYTAPTGDASLSYRMQLAAPQDSVTVHIIVKSTLAFLRAEGHRYSVGFDGAAAETVNFNSDLNEAPENIYTIFYPTVARRVIEKTVRLPLPAPDAEGTHTLTLRPLDPGVVFEKIIVDCGGYVPTYLGMDESPCRRTEE